MKLMKLAGAAAVALALTLTTGVVAPASHASVGVSFDFFYSDLSPHGSWLVSGEYGRVWQPRVYRHGWNPYYDGHWVYTDCGWTWVSDYTWGDVAYHYGTWVDDPRYGWVWVPGYTWAPAWVTFRTGPDYIGWAPVSPSFAVGFSSGGFSFGASIPVSSAFVFVSTRDFASPRLRSYIVPQTRVTTIINRTTIVNNLTIENNIVINRGPDLRTIERATRRTIRPEPIERVARVAPFTSVRRDHLAVARDMGRDRVKAAEPISARQPLPPRMSDRERRDFRRNPELSQGRRNDRFQTPTETEAQTRQDRVQPRRQDEIQQQREPRQQEIERQRPQEQRQERIKQQQDQRRQDERRQDELQQQREQRQQEVQRQRPQEQRQERMQQQNPPQRERVTPSPQEKQKEEQAQKPSRRAPKKKNPDDKKDEKKDGGGGNN